MVTTNSFSTTGPAFIRTAPRLAPNDLYANSNELQKKVYSNRFSESDFTSIQSWDVASCFGARKEIIVQFIKELKNEGIIQFLYELHYSLLPGPDTGDKFPTSNGRKITFTEAFLINFFLKFKTMKERPAVKKKRRLCPHSSTNPWHNCCQVREPAQVLQLFMQPSR